MVMVMISNAKLNVVVLNFGGTRVLHLWATLCSHPIKKSHFV